MRMIVEKAYSLMRNILMQISLYEDIHGERPGIILAEGNAMNLLANTREFYRDGHGAYYLFGIPFKRVASNGFEVYLSKGPIPIYEENSDVQSKNVWYAPEGDSK